MSYNYTIIANADATVDDEFERDAAAVGRDLDTLKGLIERSS